MPRDEQSFRLSGPVSPARERRVLLCSPDADLTARLCEALSDRGYLVESVASAAEALAAVANRAPDLLLCDDAPPSLDAMALLHTLRRSDQPAQVIPVVVLSSFGSPADIAAGKLAGADDFLAKPVQIELLEAAIAAQIRLVERVQAAVAPEAPEGLAAVDAAEWCTLIDRLSFGIILSNRAGQLLHAILLARRLAGDSQARLRDWARPQNGARPGASPAGVVGLRILPAASTPGAPDSPVVMAHLDLRRFDPAASCLATLLFLPDRPNHGTNLLAAALGLTPAETLVAVHLASGRRREQIAELMSVTMTTVNYHLRNIYQKSGTSRQSDAMRLLRSVQLAPPAAALAASVRA